MSRKKILAPSILTADFSNLSQQVRSVELGGADWIHCDVMDGKFVPNLTFGPVVVKAVRKVTKLPLDVHLMIKDPDLLIKDFIHAGADWITVHQEEVVHLNRTLTMIHELGAKTGVAINPSTPISTLSEVIHLVDMVLVMTVNPGFGGQKFIENSFRKIHELIEMRKLNSADFLIEVDGGIGLDNIRKLSEAGCDAFVVGNAIYGKDNITAATMELKNLIV
ncbi:MAG: ribulose-phosphate 3-epimerase [Ignavibacteriae bacterium HGW-Ignavibacteriae-3]|nr:MAG: ribulose-phosphate 3-epimerase [Ignavibacteriae bacterium HGW-Ignavibacteriae-3]